MKLPVTNIAGIEIGRMICGTNTFNGYSHFSDAKDKFMRRYFTVEKVVEVLEKCQELGVNAILGPVNEKTCQAQEELVKRGKSPMEWISTTLGSLDVEVLKEECRWAAEVGNKLHAIHCSFVDSHLISYKDEIEGLEELLSYIRELGMIPGISSHRPEILTILKMKKYDVNFINLPFNIDGFLCNVETNWIARMIQEIDIPIINIKPLAAGRLMPEEGIPFCYKNIKPIDAVAIGVMSPEEIEEDVAIALNCISGNKDTRKLLKTPSKSTVTLSSEEVE